MANIAFNIALGKVAYYAGLPAANDALIAVPIETSGIVSDAVMRDYDDLATLLAGASNEQTTMGRKTLASVTTTVDDTNDRVAVDSADITWTAATGNAVSALVICYDPDTTTSTDSTRIPLVKLDFPLTPDGSDVTATVTDFFRASSAA
ncbi:hypothetical protein [Kitasatospora sp. NPDC047058]|uniref:hypothetical protein n=1 Tax=Kitasatospora sp. NPDC047058 TaxID=3155620 RepID=UPI0033F1086D